MGRSFRPPARRRREVDSTKLDAPPQKRGPGTSQAKPREKLSWNGPELVVLIGGPRDRVWYTLPDLKQIWDASRECGNTPETDPMLRYRPSQPAKRRENPHYAAQGKVWLYVPSLAGVAEP